jgi:hypothetical protein
MRATVFQTVQIGVEATSGTEVPANKKLTALSIEPGARVDVGTFRPMGTKYNTLFYPAKDWTEAQVSGFATYTELAYPLSGIMKTAVITGASADKTWVWEPSATAADNIKTFSVQVGESGAGNASKFAYGTFNEFGLTFSRDSVELSGAMFGRKYSAGATLTGSPATIALVPVLPTQVSVYLDSTVGGLGTTKLTDVLRAEWRMSNRFSPYWTVDSANDSWKAPVEVPPTFEGRLLMQANTQALDLLALLRAGTKRYLRIVATGGTIPTTAVPYSLTLDTSIAFTAISAPQDQDGVYSVELTWSGTPETTWAGPTKATLVTDLAAL